MTPILGYRRVIALAFGAQLLCALALAYSRGISRAPWTREFAFAVSFTIGVAPLIAALSAGVAAFAAGEMMIARPAEANLVTARPIRALFGPVTVGTCCGVAAILVEQAIAWLQVAAATGKALIPFDLALLAVAACAVISLSAIGACSALLWPRQYTPFVVTAGLLGLYFALVNTSLGRVLQIAGGTAPPTGLAMRWPVIGWWLLALAAIGLVAMPFVAQHWRQGLGLSPPTWLSAILAAALLLVGLVIIPHRYLGIRGHEFVASTALPDSCSTRTRPRVCVWADASVDPDTAQRALSPAYRLLRQEHIITAPVTYYSDYNGRQTGPGRGALGLVTDSDGTPTRASAFTSVLTTRECSRTVFNDKAALAYYDATTIGSLWITARLHPGRLPHLSARQGHWLTSPTARAWMKRMIASINACHVGSAPPPPLWASYLE